ncbi:WXG100 family type VII secretion target [Ectobacillus sp. JY-23]|uniref:WXG100 family type VII secretion target n=1 Tax=Ectobacillus sp. JY-23 TaxID=2933872 RepID=UPI001FF6A149|nr:WXG100 family type VII secretion target [Ectobacillus sp. JY-23]UOY91681.1 WXG100 family type VII secretion target [Ectobacillus sp. JY-23]
MARILVTPDQLEGIARQFRDGINQAQGINSKLQGQIHNLYGEWDGNTKNRFQTQFGEAEKLMKGYTEILQSIEMELKNIATRFRQADQG